MFCQNCGTQIADGVAFCSNCGASVNGAVAAPAPVAPAPNVYDYQMQKNAIRQGEIDSLQRTMDYFMQKKDTYEMYDAVCTLVNYYAGGAKKSLLVWGAIIATFGFFAAGMGAGGAGVAAFIIPGAAMIVGGILMQVNNRKKYAYYQEQYAELSQELYDHYMSYPNCPIGPEYSNPEIIALIMEVLRSGRADTIKESINVLINEANQSDVAAYLEMIESNTAAINQQTKVAAFFAAASFFD